MVHKAKSIQVFGRLKDEHGHIIFTCSASSSAFATASAECVRLAKGFMATKPKTGSECGCSKQAKPSYKIQMCECCNTQLIMSCNGTSVDLL